MSNAYGSVPAAVRSEYRLATSAATAHTTVSPNATAFTAVMPFGTWVRSPMTTMTTVTTNSTPWSRSCEDDRFASGALSSTTASFTTTSIFSALLIRPAARGQLMFGRRAPPEPSGGGGHG